MRMRSWASCLLIVVVTSCAPGAASRGDGGAALGTQTAPKRMIAAIMSDPPTVSTNIGTGVAILPGIDSLQALVHAGMSIADEHKTLHPRLAEAVQSVENGLWQVLADGSMV